MTTSPTFGQIRARVQAVRRKVPDARVVGIRTPGRYAGERLRPDGAETYRIEQCDSPLAARVALVDEEPGVTITVLVTGLSERDLGDDVLVRLAKGKLFAIDSWQMVKELFQAQTVDPRLRQHAWIADHLLGLAGEASPPPAAGGYLDAEAVWPVLLERLIGLTGDRPDLAALLRWSAVADNVQRFRRLPAEPRRVITDWLTTQVGPAAAAIFRCAATLDGPDALPVGLVLGVVHHPKAGGRLDRAAGRLERFLGGATPEAAVLDRWHAAATEAVRLLDSDPRAKGQLLHRADEILREVQAEEFAYLSDVLPRGFDQRLARLGDLLGEAVEGGAVLDEALREARDAVRRHDQARREPRRLERAEMALRLVRWLEATPDAAEPQSLPEAARAYLAEGSFVDWARSVLRAGDPVRGLSEGYARLLRKVAERREAQNRRFAEFLRDQTATGGNVADLLPVERILDELVAPLARQGPVLLIVLDGMNSAVARELLSDVTRLDWVSLGKEGRPVPSGLATIPCVTEASRASLLCGRLSTGTADNEVTGFAAHAGLRSHRPSGPPPVLFHKIALQEAADASLAANVREAIASPQKRVVGVVVNAVDDHLLKGEQLDLRWTRDEIKVLPSLLYEARSARRVVVLLSDHGHLLEHQTSQSSVISHQSSAKQLKTDKLITDNFSGGERWRADDGQAGDGELVVQGLRVLLAEGQRLIAPWDERTRYGAKKNGYHGGLTPQEMLIPIAVLVPADLRLEGWSETPDPTPDWWEEPPTPPPAVVSAVKPPRKTPETLWDLAEQEAPPHPEAPPPKQPARLDWVAALLACPLFAAQKRLGGRAVPPDEVFGKLLAALDGVGGKMTATALARRLEMPLFRLRGLLAVVQRVLNVEGYAVLGRDEASDTVEMDRDLLLRQFDLLAE
ncbi:MAG TPA: BREX-2 system phosphatase PglZ [Gemmataceae bacterium]|nr:BREX-2 system phosphatase PglZ [Gemmataceae bacterium]